jgi:hypothetical protein
MQFDCFIAKVSPFVIRFIAWSISIEGRLLISLVMINDSLITRYKANRILDSILYLLLVMLVSVFGTLC